MRTSLFIREKSIGYDSFHYLCQFLHIETPRLNARISDDVLTLLNLHVDSKEFIDYLRSSPVELNQKPFAKPFFDVSKADELINKFRRFNVSEIDDGLAKQILSAIGVRLNLAYYSEENFEKIHEIFVQRIPAKEKLIKLLDIEYFSLKKKTKTVKVELDDRHQFNSEYDSDSEDAIMRALQGGYGDLYGFD